ncbi:alpha/beta hydrolase [Geodermatophilus sp. CPCC 206100]|uniref:alpha/beta hydrolase n=1 Tax=Geodermatophilus sp. CPCC 206100 TaxID=3020054 RepID=UPI003B008A3C
MTSGLPTGGPQLVDVPAEDGTLLQGLLLPPPDRPRAALLHVHGKGGNFYSGPPRTLPPHLAPDRFLHLSLNLRCHDLAYSRLGDAPGIATGPEAAYGGMWERLDEGPADIAAGVAWLRERTGLPVVVVGHSAGGYFLGDWGPGADGIAARVFLSPLTSVRFPLTAWYADDAALEEAHAHAQALVDAGQGHLLLPVPAWYFAISAASFLERLAERPDRWLDGVNASSSPLLLAWGGAETRVPAWRELFDRMTVADRVSAEVPGAGHEYGGAEAGLAREIARFVEERV